MKPKFLIVLLLSALAVFGVAVFLLQKQPSPVAVPQPPAVRKISADDLAALAAKAGAGDVAAQLSLGKIYLEGSSVKADPKQAVKWFQMAAEKNVPEALAMLGELTQAGQGLPQNLEEAARLYRRAAEAGNVAGQYNLAFLYEQGTGVKQDETEAATWYQLAAEGGDPLAQYDIGQRYLLGVGVPKNQVQAFKWFALAAAQGQPDSAKVLSDLKRQMSAADLAEAGRLVSEFKPRSPAAAN